MAQNSSTRNFSFVAVGRIVTIAIQAIFYLVFASLLEPESYGELSVIIALAATFATFSRFGLNLSLQVNQAKKNSEISNQIISLFIISTAAASLILVLIEPIAAVLCFAISSFIMYQQNLLGLKKYRAFMLSSIFKSILFFIIPLALFFVLEIPGIVLGMAISNLIASVIFFKDLKIKKFFRLKNYYKVLIHNFAIDSSGSLVLSLDKLLIGALFGFFIVGVYQFNLLILIALGVVPGILASYLITEESSGASHKKITHLTILVSVGLAILTIILAPIFVNEFFSKYSEGILSLQILALNIIPQSIGVFFGTKLLAKESTKIGFSAIVRIGSLLILIVLLGQFYGLVGLSLAFLFSTMIGVFFQYLLYRREIMNRG